MSTAGPSISTNDEAVLTVASSLLDSVGAQASVPAEVVTPCLLAATLLESAGGQAHRVSLVDGQARPSILAALAALAQLDAATFAGNDVLEASRAARDALAELG